jgi:hypothetical protein
MSTLKKLSMAVGLATVGAGAGHAQSIGASCGCPDVSVRTQVNVSTLVDVNGNLLNPTTTLTCNNLYILNARMYVNAGQDLFIEPGTVIKAQLEPRCRTCHHRGA